MGPRTPPGAAVKRAFLRLLPLWGLAYLAFHAYEHSPIRVGRDALLARLAATAHFELERVGIVLPLCAYGLLFAARPPAVSAPFAVTLRVSGVVAFPLLLLHLGAVWLPRRAARAPTAAYVGMLEATRGATGIALVLLFVTASVLHLSLAAIPALESAAPSPRAARVLAALVGVALWSCWLDLLSAYGAGRALL